MFYVQGVSMLLAMILKALGPYPERYYESDDDYSPDRVPLLKHYAPPPSYVVADTLHPSRNDSWNVRINSKVGLQYFSDYFWRSVNFYWRDGILMYRSSKHVSSWFVCLLVFCLVWYFNCLQHITVRFDIWLCFHILFLAFLWVCMSIILANLFALWENCLSMFFYC